MIKKQIEFIPVCDEFYPKRLKEIYDPPVGLYVKGDKKILRDLSLAIIGTRNPSQYGEEITKKFAYELAGSNINIISGGAKGIDSCAHIRNA